MSAEFNTAVSDHRNFVASCTADLRRLAAAFSTTGNAVVADELASIAADLDGAAQHIWTVWGDYINAEFNASQRAFVATLYAAAGLKMSADPKP